ncbi:MAG: acyl-[acyl-carrier-protein] thioesterase [Spirochaeta sp.]
MQQIPLIDSYTLRPNEVDVEHLLKLSSLADMFQNSAWRSAELLGFGYHALVDQGLAWVLSRLHIKIHAYPAWGETIQVHTWPKRVDRLFALRDFQVFSSNDISQPVIEATSAWLLVDGKTKRPRKVESLEQPIPSHNVDAITDTPSKIILPDSYAHSLSFPVRRSNLDMNFHTNNACYIGWIEDSLPMEMYLKRRIHELRINFIGESFVGDILGVEYNLHDSAAGRMRNQKDQEIIHFEASLSSQHIKE